MKLPEPKHEGKMSVEAALAARRSVRSFTNEPLTLADVSQLLWAAQGITHPEGLRTAPSAGATYPLEIYVVAGTVKDLAAGVYRYRSRGHELTRVAGGDRRADLASAAHEQEWTAEASVAFVIAAVYERTTAKYGERGRQYVHHEVGHAAQNICLQAVALGFGTTVVGALDDTRVKKVVGLEADEEPFCLLPVGKPQ